MCYTGNMKNKFKKVREKSLEVLGTALVAGGLAFLQSFLSQKGIQCGPELDPVSTAGVGAALSSVKVLFLNRV